MNPLTIHPMCKCDVAFLFELMNKSEIMSVLHMNKTNILYWQEFFTASLSDDDEENFIIYQDDRPCAWLKINGLLNNDTSWISMLVVNPNVWWQGIGKFAVDFSESFVKVRDFNKLSIRTTEDNLPAQGLYKKCGYAITGHDGDEVEKKSCIFAKML